MTSILQELAHAAQERANTQKDLVSLDELREQARQTAHIRQKAHDSLSFRDALAKPGMSFICECKKASPSKGLIAPDFPYLDIAREYEAAGASAISVLTEPTRFLGSDEYLKEIASTVAIPTLRKDFIVDEYMIYQAKTLGASAVLLICALLDASTLLRYLSVCDEVGLDALVEAHDDDEVRRAVSCGARVIGVNNRNLADFSVDFENSIRLRSRVPPEVLFVTESGIKSADDITLLAAHGVDAVLIGETLMRANDKAAMLGELSRGAQGAQAMRGER